MQIKIVKLPLLFLIVALFAGLSVGVTQVKADNTQATMLWEMQANESLMELAAKFYPKSATMQRVFIAKTQQLNQDTQVYADANTRYPTTTKVVIPTLKSLSVRGTGVKKVRHAKKSSEKAMQDDQELSEKKQALEEALTKKNENIKALEEKMNQLKQQLDQPQNTPADH